MKSGYVTYTGPVGKKGHSSFCWLYRNAWLWGVGWGQGGGTAIRWDLTPLPLLYTLMKAYLDSKFLPYILSKFHAIRIQHSLRSKRLRSSYCAKVGVRERRGEGKRKNFFLSWSPSPLIPPFCSRPTFVEEHARKRLLRRLFSTRARFPVGKTPSYVETFCLPNKTGHDS